MRTFLDSTRCHLAVSLHTPFEDERRRLMPIENVHPLSEVLAELRARMVRGQRRVSFEYIVFDGLNDTPRHARELARILDGIRCRVNLISFHAIPGTPLGSGPPGEDGTIPGAPARPRDPHHDPPVTRPGHRGGLRPAFHPGAGPCPRGCGSVKPPPRIHLSRFVSIPFATLIYALSGAVVGASAFPSALVVIWAARTLLPQATAGRIFLFCLAAGGALYLLFFCGLLLTGLLMRLLSAGVRRAGTGSSRARGQCGWR